MRLAFLLISVAACGGAAAAPARAPITLTYTGVAGWQIDAGARRVLVDPFFSRQPVSDHVAVDAAAVAAHAPARADVIVVGHSHFDHVLDVPAVAKQTGAQVIGSATTIAYARAQGVADDHLVPVQGGEDYQLGGGLSVRVIPSLHSALNAKHGLATPPGGFAEGGTFAYLVRVPGHEIFVMDTANFIEREVDGLRPDVAIVAPGARQEIHDYACRLMRALGAPPLVIATHFDAWTQPLGPHQMDIGDDARADLDAFAAEIHACAPHTRVVIPEHFKAITVP